MAAVQGIGLAIGDDVAVVCGYGSDLGDWSFSQPAIVCAPSMAARVEILLAGTEALAAGTKPLLQHPRRRGYVPGDPGVARELLAALLATLRQQVPPAYFACPTNLPVLAVPHSTRAEAAAVLAEAARAAGWGEVRVVSEVAALAALAATRGGGSELVSSVPDRGRLLEGDFTLAPEGSTVRLRLEALRSRAVAEGEGAPAFGEAELARGAAHISAEGERLRLELSPELPLQIGLLSDDGSLIPLGKATEPGRIVRALCPPSPDGAMLQLAAGCEGAPPQVVAQALLDPAASGGQGEPWLALITMEQGLRGELEIQGPGRRTIQRQPFQIRLP